MLSNFWRILLVTPSGRDWTLGTWCSVEKACQGVDVADDQLIPIVQEGKATEENYGVDR